MCDIGVATPVWLESMRRSLRRGIISLLAASALVACGGHSRGAGEADATTGVGAHGGSSGWGGGTTTAGNAGSSGSGGTAGSSGSGGSSGTGGSGGADASIERDAAGMDGSSERDVPVGADREDGALGDRGAPSDGDATNRGADGDATSADLVTQCEGSVLQGSFVIRNLLDVQTIAGYAQITGDVEISAPGLTTISLPLLCSVGGAFFTLDTPDLVTLDLPSLISARSFVTQGAPLTTIHVQKLAVADELKVFIDGPLDLASLVSAESFSVSFNPSVIDAPKLTRVGSMWVSAGIMKADALLTAGGISLESAHLTAARLTAVENWFYIQAASDVDVPALASVGGDFWYMIDVSKTFPALSSIGQRFRIETTAATLSFPALTSIGGDVSITDSAPGSSISLPVLQALNGIATPASIDVIGSFSAPAVIGANKGLVIRSVSSLDLSALQSVGDAMAPCGHDGINRAHWMNVLDLAALRVSVLQLPALTSACVQVGLAIQQCISGNPSLVQIVAPNLTAGGVRFFDNPSFPKCRAEALAAQIPNPVQYPPPFVDAGLGAIHCPLASGPCP